MGSALDSTNSQKLRETPSSPISTANLLKGLTFPKGFPGFPEDWDLFGEIFAGRQNESLFELYAEKKESESQHFHAVWIIHGMGEHGGRYMHFPSMFQGKVHSVSCVDLYGHGRSEGVRGHVDRFDRYLEDSEIALERLHGRLKKKGKPFQIHLFAHSLGGVIGLSLLQKHSDLPLSSAIFSAPAVRWRHRVDWLRRSAAYGLSKFWGNLQIESGLKAETKVSHDKNVQHSYQTDQLVHSKATPRFLVEFEKALERIWSWQGKVRYPSLFLSPGADPIVDPEGTKEFFARWPALEKKMISYPGFFHEAVNEIEKQKVFGDLLEWIQKKRNDSLD